MSLRHWILLWLAIGSPFTRRMMLAFYVGGLFVLLVVVGALVTAAAVFVVETLR